jgi:hypothetical protein
MLSGAVVAEEDGRLMISWLESHGGGVIHIRDDPRFTQDCVVVFGACLSQTRGNVRGPRFPALEIPDHALARMFHRSPSIDAATALREAASAWLSADASAVRASESVILPAGAGLLLCLPIDGLRPEGGKTVLYASARTFFRRNMAFPDQRPVAPAVVAPRSVLATFKREQVEGPQPSVAAGGGRNR